MSRQLGASHNDAEYLCLFAFGRQDDSKHRSACSDAAARPAVSGRSPTLAVPKRFKGHVLAAVLDQPGVRGNAEGIAELIRAWVIETLDSLADDDDDNSRLRGPLRLRAREQEL